MKKIIFLFLISIFNFSAFSESLSFQIFQHSKGVDKVSEEALQVEDELLNYFFEKGKIVSNEQTVVSVSEKADSNVVSKSINNCAEGSVELFCQIHLFFDIDEKSENKDLFRNLKKIVWKISSVNNPKITKENIIIVNKPGNADSEDFAKSLAYEIACQMQNYLKSKA